MGNGNPLLSICFITYNHENFLGDALKGFASQQVNFPIEIIIYDDFSTDATRHLLLEFKKTSPFPVTLLLPDENKYSKGERIFPKTFEVATGKYLALCEGDDYWTDPLKLQKQVDFLEANSDYNICFHKVNILNQETGEIIPDTIRDTPETTDITELARGNYIHTASVVLRNNFKLPDWFRETFIGDWSLYMIMVADKKIKKLEEVMAVYRVHNTSMWSSKPSEFIKKNTLKSVILVYENAHLPEEVKGILHNRIHRKKQTFLQRFKKRAKKFVKRILNLE